MADVTTADMRFWESPPPHIAFAPGGVDLMVLTPQGISFPGPTPDDERVKALCALLAENFAFAEVVSTNSLTLKTLTATQVQSLTDLELIDLARYRDGDPIITELANRLELKTQED